MTDRREFAAFLRRMRTLALAIAGVIALGTIGLRRRPPNPREIGATPAP